MKAYMSYRSGEKGAESRWCPSGFDWWSGAEVDNDARDAVHEAERILAETEGDYIAGTFDEATAARHVDTVFWVHLEDDTRDYLAESLSAFIESEVA